MTVTEQLIYSTGKGNKEDADEKKDFMRLLEKNFLFIVLIIWYCSNACNQ